MHKAHYEHLLRPSSGGVVVPPGLPLVLLGAPTMRNDPGRPVEVGRNAGTCELIAELLTQAMPLSRLIVQIAEAAHKLRLASLPDGCQHVFMLMRHEKRRAIFIDDLMRHRELELELPETLADLARVRRQCLRRVERHRTAASCVDLNRQNAQPELVQDLARVRTAGRRDALSASELSK